MFHPDLPSSSTYIQQPLPDNNYNPQPSFNQNYMQQPMPNLKDIIDPIIAMNMALIAQPGNQVIQNTVQNLGVQNVGNQNGVIVVSGIANHNGNGNVIAARAEGNANGNNEAGIQLQAKEFDLMATAADLDEIEEVNANCILMANLQSSQICSRLQISCKKAVESSVKHKALELEIERLLRAILSQDIMSIVQNNYVVDTSNLQTELERTKERLENCIIKKENEYAKLWNDWYKKCEECKYDKISYDKAYNDMQQNIKRLRAQLGDQKGKSKDTPCVSQKVYKTNDLSNPVTSNSVRTTKELKVVENDKVIAPGMFRINSFKKSRKEKYVPNKPIKTSVRTNPVTVPQPHVITKKVVNSDSNGLSSTGVDITTKTRRPQPRSNTKNDRVPSASKSSRFKNKEVEVEDHSKNLLLSKIKKHMSSKCNNVKLAIRNDKSKIVCAMCKQCLITANHDVCVLNYVHGMNSRGKKQK
ncbi:hypothetical protein Tco_0826697, partial [Tanacetum coccineum]